MPSIVSAIEDSDGVAGHHSVWTAKQEGPEWALATTPHLGIASGAEPQTKHETWQTSEEDKKETGMKTRAPCRVHWSGEGLASSLNYTVASREKYLEEGEWVGGCDLTHNIIKQKMNQGVLMFPTSFQSLLKEFNTQRKRRKKPPISTSRPLERSIVRLVRKTFWPSLLAYQGSIS